MFNYTDSQEDGTEIKISEITPENVAELWPPRDLVAPAQAPREVRRKLA